MLARPSSSCNSSSPWPSALLQMAPGAFIIHNPSSKIQTCSRQLVASLQTFAAGIMGNKTHPVTLQLMRTPSNHCSDQMLRTFSAGVQVNGFSHVLNYNRGT